MPRSRHDIFKTVAQVVAILCLAGILAMIAHKGYTDMSALARNGSGQGFFLDFLRYVFRNLAG